MSYSQQSMRLAKRRTAPAATALRLAVWVAAFAVTACAAPGPDLPRVPTTSSQAAAPAGKPRIERAAQMPRFQYPVKGSLESIVRSPAAFAGFAAPLRRDTLAVLADYEIADKAMQRDLHTLLAVLDYLGGDYAASLARLKTVQSLEDKPADRWVSGLRLRAAATAALAHAPGSPAYTQAVGKYLDQALAAMPYAQVANEIRELKSAAEISGEGLALGRVRAVLQPLADTNGHLTHETAPGLAYARLALEMTLPLKATFVAAFDSYLQANKVEKPDIWAARDLRLPSGAAYAPVPVAVWDSGVDVSLFGPQVLRAPDGNARVIGFDRYAQPAHTELAPLPADVQARLPLLLGRSKGFSDLQSDIDSAEAAEVKRWLSTLDANQFRPAVEELNLVGNYEHGTHVAGIALAGNPYARLVVARIEFGYTLKPDPCPSRELVERDVRNTFDTVAFFQRHGVRVVNMSWGGSVGDVEAELEKCGGHAEPKARQALARELFDLQKNGLTRAMGRAPEILFIAAAGNENQDASFSESTPADIALPNLLTVGAVDQAGDEASFTSYGPTVKLHANGYQVESYLPGGSRVALSGTSMAAPQAANLAAKLLAVKPGLQPTELIRLMVETADATADGRRRLMNPKRALAALPGG